jgi:hypothetical protein
MRSLPLPGRSALHQPQMIHSLGQRADGPVLRCQDVCMSGLTHANKPAAQVPAKKLDPPGGPPPFARMGPTAGCAYESARTMPVLSRYMFWLLVTEWLRSTGAVMLSGAQATPTMQWRSIRVSPDHATLWNRFQWSIHRTRGGASRNEPDMPYADLQRNLIA